MLPLLAAALLPRAALSLPSSADLAVVTFAKSGAQNQLRNNDAFPSLTPLQPFGRVTLLNASAPMGGGVVTSIHLVITSQGPREAMNANVLVAVTYEGGAGPAFAVPVAAFFSDAFSDAAPLDFEATLFARRTTHSLHCRAPMPFRRSVLVELVSTFGERVDGYAIATYETGSALAPPAGGALGYFMAQHSNQPSPDWPFEATSVLPERVAGAGHVVFVGYTATTNRSDLMTVRNHFNGVCEGNWNFFVDNSTERPGNSSDPSLLSWLGSEDFFGQSFGWTPEVFERAGTTFINGSFPEPIRMATYRDMSDAPLRFSKSLAAAVQWDWDHARIPAACVNNRGACPVNFTTSVFYYLTNTTRTQARGRLYSGL